VIILDIIAIIGGLAVVYMLGINFINRILIKHPGNVLWFMGSTFAISLLGSIFMRTERENQRLQSLDDSEK